MRALGNAFTQCRFGGEFVFLDYSDACVELLQNGGSLLTCHSGTNNNCFLPKQFVINILSVHDMSRYRRIVQTMNRMGEPSRIQLIPICLRQQ